MIVLALTLMLAADAPSTVERPDWITTPSNSDMADWMPDKARENHVEGSASMDCDVTPKGTLEKCVVTQEQPEGYGFGKAALKVARKFKMKPTSLDGQPTAGARVSVPLHWTDNR
ncbi:MAG: TonB family protein [Proteobacteria bacterium]|nr:TonB family protein [Pseudomonadota bacterium]